MFQIPSDILCQDGAKVRLNFQISSVGGILFPLLAVFRFPSWLLFVFRDAPDVLPLKKMSGECDVAAKVL
jgi:hypothetical protein